MFVKTNFHCGFGSPSFITGSYDRTCKIWDTASGEELHTLEGHKNVVYAVAYNNPYGWVSHFQSNGCLSCLFHQCKNSNDKYTVFPQNTFEFEFSST